MQQVAISALVVVMMLAVGLRTEPRDFVPVLRRPRVLAVLLVANLLLVPLCIAGLIAAVPLPDGMAVGLVLFAAAPGGATGPLFVMQGRGDLPTAVTGLVLLSIVSVLSTPPTVGLMLGGLGTVDPAALVLPMMATLALYQLSPLLLGMGVRRLRPELAMRAARPMALVANALLLVIIVGLLAAKGHLLLSMGGSALVASVVAVALCLGLGMLGESDRARRRSLAITTGVRNISLSLLIAAAYFPEPSVDAAVLTVGLFTMLMPWGLAVIYRARGE